MSPATKTECCPAGTAAQPVMQVVYDTIAPRNPARGVLTFVVTLTTFHGVSSYPCRSLESATRLAHRFIAGVTKPRPSAPEQPAPVAEPVAA
jgi:hypothetical protein